ncbi:MAG: DUF4124 domain-containing protein [Woeseiaceae bacterium]|nr:DUF4124 domain-containing protein [Woeseiaceae bacterium]
MKRLFAAGFLILGLGQAVHADVWKWVDANGDTHFVDTMKPIYTWVDEFGKSHYSDTPDHEDAVSVEFLWHSSGTLDEVAMQAGEDGAAGGSGEPGETEEERAEREAAEAYYCKRATEIYESYVNAPQLYRTNESGEREYLSKEEAERTLAETRAKKDELCN